MDLTLLQVLCDDQNTIYRTRSQSRQDRESTQTVYIYSQAGDHYIGSHALDNCYDLEDAQICLTKDFVLVGTRRKDVTDYNLEALGRKSGQLLKELGDNINDMDKVGGKIKVTEKRA